jgi:hypothetical protein
VNKLFILSALPLLACLSSACTVETEEDEENVGVTRAALLSENALAANALAANALAANALAANALAANALAANSLAAIQASTPAGADAREFVRYTVSCALDVTQTFAFNWTDTHDVVHTEIYVGLLGIAPTWATAPLTDETQQRLVSSCLAARVNWYGLTVLISVRSSEDPLQTLFGSLEVLAYPRVEGAFWGNLFTETPYLNACYNAANVTNSRAAHRDCAAGHLDAGGHPVPCGMIALAGACSDVCGSVTSAGYYSSCEDHPTEQDGPSTTAVITTALPLVGLF